MLNSDYLHRLKKISHILKATPCDINSLLHKLSENNISALKRQIYRDIKAVEKYFLTETEEMLVTEINNKKKQWKIIVKPENKIINTDDVYARILLKHTLPAYIRDDVKDSVKTDLIDGINLKYKQNRISSKLIDCNDAIIKSYFNEKAFSEKAYKIFKDLFWCILNQIKIKVKISSECFYSMINETSDNSSIIISPISFIQHNGAIMVAGITPKKRILIFDLCELKEYEYLKLSYKNKLELTELLNVNLSRRFGISENIDENVYDVEIELSKHLGEYLKNFNWHHSQKFKIKENVVVMQLKCGINRELICWISMFETKAKIIKPEKLKMLFYQNLIRMSEVYLTNKNVR